MKKTRTYITISLILLIIIGLIISYLFFINPPKNKQADISQQSLVTSDNSNTLSSTENKSSISDTSKNIINIKTDDIEVTKPTFDEVQNIAYFKVSNTSKFDLSATIIVESYNNGILSNTQEHPITIKSGTTKEQCSVSAKKGDVIKLIDKQGNIYLQPFEIGAMEWVGTWASAQQGLDSSRTEYPPEPGLANNTFRQIVRISIGGMQFRFKFSNEYGKTPLVINSVHISKPSDIGTSTIDPNFDTAVTFNEGSESVTIPAGQIAVSDIINYNASDLERIAVSVYFGSVPEIITSHTGARTTSYLIAGNHVSDISFKDPIENEVWYFLTGIDVLSNPGSKAIVCLGDSITDGRGVKTNYDTRWTDVLAERLVKNPKTAHISVLNQGIGGNSIFGGLGPAAIKRYKRDVLNQPNVGYVIIFEGINDIGYTNSLSSADMIINEYKKFADQAHAKDIKVIGATITPFGGTDYAKNYWEIREEVRQKINAWIRNNEYFDGYIDFDAAIRDEKNPSFLIQEYSTDGLHPNVAGYKKMGESIDLSLFED